MIIELSRKMVRAILCVAYHQITKKITDMVTNQPWTSNENILIAQMALDIAQMIKKGDDDTAVFYQCYPSYHSRRVIDRLYNVVRQPILKEVNIEVEKQKNTLYTCLMGEEKTVDKSLMAKAVVISNSHDDMGDQTTKFIWEMKKDLGWLWAGISKQNDCMDG